jgi:hypothetical protein
MLKKVFNMQTNQPSLGYITLIYTGFHLGIAIAINLALWALERFAGFAIQANSVAWMPLILGAMFTGQNYGTKTGVKPPQSYAWMAGLLFTLVSLVLSVAVVYAVAVAVAEGVDISATVAQMRAELGDDAGLIAGIAGGFFLLIWVLHRFIFSVGAVQGAKVAAKGK